MFIKFPKKSVDPNRSDEVTVEDCAKLDSQISTCQFKNANKQSVPTTSPITIIQLICSPASSAATAVTTRKMRSRHHQDCPSLSRLQPALQFLSPVTSQCLISQNEVSVGCNVPTSADNCFAASCVQTTALIRCQGCSGGSPLASLP